MQIFVEIQYTDNVKLNIVQSTVQTVFVHVTQFSIRWDITGWKEDGNVSFFLLLFSIMTMSVKAEPQKTSGPQECAGCGKKIQDR